MVVFMSFERRQERTTDKKLRAQSHMPVGSMHVPCIWPRLSHMCYKACARWCKVHYTDAGGCVNTAASSASAGAFLNWGKAGRGRTGQGRVFQWAG